MGRARYWGNEGRIAALERERDEAERLLRLSYKAINQEDVGDKSLAAVRQGQSGELADIALAIEAHDRELRAEVERLHGLLEQAHGGYECPGEYECDICSGELAKRTGDAALGGGA